MPPTPSVLKMGEALSHVREGGRGPLILSPALLKREGVRSGWAVPPTPSVLGMGEALSHAREGGRGPLILSPAL